MVTNLHNGKPLIVRFLKLTNFSVRSSSPAAHCLLNHRLKRVHWVILTNRKHLDITDSSPSPGGYSGSVKEKLNHARILIGSASNLLEDRRITSPVLNKCFILLYKTRRLHVDVGLLSKRSQNTSKCGNNVSDTFCWAAPRGNLIPRAPPPTWGKGLGTRLASWATFVFSARLIFTSPFFLELERRKASWNLFVNYTSQTKLLAYKE